MAYQQRGGYGQPGGNPYAQQGNPYVQQNQGNPYAQQNQGNPYAQQNYGQPQQQNYGRNPYDQTNNIEMAPVRNNAPGGGGGGGGSSRDILNRCSQVSAGIQELDRMVGDLKMAQNASLQDSNQNPQQNHRLDELTSRIFEKNRQLVQEIKQIKSTPGAANPNNVRQVQLVEDNLKKSFNGFQSEEMNYRRKFEQQLVRQYRVVNPNASQAEAQEAAQNPDGGVFAQALLQSDRRGQAQSTLSNVRSRHAAIQQVERQMIELGELFNQMNELVVAQEPMTMQINDHTEKVHEDLVAADQNLEGATKKARAARKKKWWCLLICILILIAIAIIAFLGVCFGLHQCPGIGSPKS